MFKTFPRLKRFTFFFTQIKTTRFLVLLIVLGKWKVPAGLQIHLKKILGRTNKARDKGALGAQIRHVSKARKVQRHEGA